MPSDYQNPYEGMSQEEMLAKIMAEGQGGGSGRPLTLPGIGVRGPDINAPTMPGMPPAFPAPGPRGGPAPDTSPVPAPGAALPAGQITPNAGGEYVQDHPGIGASKQPGGVMGTGPAARSSRDALRRRMEEAGL